MENDKVDIDTLRKEAEHYRDLLQMGGCTYEEARAHVDPYIKAVNEKAKEIAKKYGRRAPKMSPMAFLR